jgi:hypothetical protein
MPGNRENWQATPPAHKHSPSTATFCAGSLNAPELETSSAPVPAGFVGAFQNRKTMCYAADVAESGGLDRTVRIFGSRSGVRDFPCRAHPEVLQ